MEPEYTPDQTSNQIVPVRKRRGRLFSRLRKLLRRKKEDPISLTQGARVERKIALIHETGEEGSLPTYNPVFDRGDSPFFVGRTKTRETFLDMASDFRIVGKGSTFLVQGAPGSGKTALLAQLSKESQNAGWTVAKITPDSLHSPASMAQSLGKSYTSKGHVEVAVDLRILQVGGGETIAGHATPIETLRHLTPPNGLILVLDEAQRVKDLSDHSEIRTTAGNTLNAIHNGEIGHSVMLLAAGLGSTLSAFDYLGVSRPEGECMVHLGSLGKEHERDLIGKWLKDKGFKGDTDAWIHAIAERSHGWPQHIMSYIKGIKAYVKSRAPLMTDEGLHFVIERGDELRENYYKIRVRDINKEKRQLLARFFADVPFGKTVLEGDIKSAIMKEYSPEESDKLFDDTLKKGVIDQRGDGSYSIPIPSMHTWLVEEYANDKLNEKSDDHKPK